MLKDEVKRQEQLAEHHYLDKIMPLIFKRWPEIIPNTANRNMIVEFCGGALAVDISAVELCLENETPSGLIHRLAIASVDQQKSQLIDRICQKLKGKQSHDPVNDKFIIENKRKQMTFWSLEKLRERLQHLENVVDLQNKSTGELRNIVKQSTATPGFPVLPRQIVPPGRVKSIPLDGQYIRNLDREDLRRIIRVYGADQINFRLRSE